MPVELTEVMYTTSASAKGGRKGHVHSEDGVIDLDLGLPGSQANPKANPDLEMVALKCLQKPPDHRYPHASALADDLDAFLAGEPVSARSLSFRTLATRLLGETHNAAILEKAR